ncbi:MAG: hypothetical protein LBH19_06330 [Dysgonamonadaceae bacterium]|jgi:hypothetical protein|nr:hypothetical protein [Dysgonamonadaceae bacterium]
MSNKTQAKGRLVLWVGALAIVASFTSCEMREEPFCPPVSDRVLLAYFGGENNLSGETYQKIEALRAGLSPDKADCKVLIYHDPSNGAPVLSEMKTKNGQVISDTVAAYKEENSASANVFARVIKEIKETYPARAYSLLLFSHGSGWLPQGALSNPELRSVVMDGTAEMEIADFARAIPDKTFDCIVFEACLMAGIEVAYELKDKTEYIFASCAEIVSPGFTEIYPDALHLLLEGNLTAFAAQVFDYFDRQTGEMRSATFSLVKTDGLSSLATFIAENCDPDLPVDSRAVQQFDRNNTYRLFFDFEDYYSRLLDSSMQRTELRRLIGNCVIWKEATPSFLLYSNGFYINRHSGLTTYIPQQNFPALNSRYEETEWRKALQR